MGARSLPPPALRRGWLCQESSGQGRAPFLGGSRENFGVGKAAETLAESRAALPRSRLAGRAQLYGCISPLPPGFPCSAANRN